MKRCSVCGREFNNAKSMTNHRRHHSKGFSERWYKKIEPYKVVKHSEESKKRMSEIKRTGVNYPDSSRARARHDYGSKPCELCGASKSEIHHKDGDVFNNERSNIMFVCRKHHMELDGRLEEFINIAKIKDKPWLERDSQGRYRKVEMAY